MVYLALEIHIFSFHIFFPSPLGSLFLPRLCFSLLPRHVVHHVLFVSLLDLSANLFISTESYNGLLPVPFPQPKATAVVSKICSLSVGKCLQQKPQMAENDHSEQLMSLTTPDREIIECNKE